MKAKCCVAKYANIIILALISQISKADVFSCITSGYSNVSTNNAATSNNGNDQEWIVNTDRGFTMSVVRNFQGACEKNSYLIRCIDNELSGTTFRSFEIYLLTGYFISNYHSFQYNRAENITWIGSCFRV
jgi:hypothetical protein